MQDYKEQIKDLDEDKKQFLNSIVKKAIEINNVRLNAGFEDKEYITNCFIESCNQCDILYKRIPELVDINE